MSFVKNSGVLLLAATLTTTAFAAPKMPIPSVVVSDAVTAPDVYTRRYVGNILPINNVYSTAKVSGDLLVQGFKDGEFVKAGQMLFEIDPTRYAAAVRSTEAKISQIKAKLAYAELNLKRKKELLDKKATSLDTYQNVLSERDTLKAQLAEAEAALILAKDDLKNTKIIAMTSGKTGKAAFSPGNYVTPSSGTLVQTVQTDPIRVRFAISARDYLSLFGNAENIRKNGIVTVKLADDSNFKYKGEIEIVDSSIQQESDTIRVWARFKNPDNLLIPYGVVTVILTRDDGKKYPAVVPSAVSHDIHGSFVYVVDPQTKMANKRYVQLGNVTGDLQVLRSGIKAGETVVTEGFHKILPGVPVNPVKRGEK